MRLSNEGVNLSSLYEIDDSFFYQTQVRVFSWFDKVLLPILALIEIAALYFIQDYVISHLKKWILSITVVFGGIAFYWLWILDGRLYWRLKQMPLFQTPEERALRHKKIAIYERLRVIEPEQIVFDPVSGREEMLHGTNIVYLVDELAMDDLLNTCLR